MAKTPPTSQTPTFATQLVQATLPQFISKIEIRSAYAPPVIIDVQEAVHPPPPGSPQTPAQRALARAQPVVILTGPGVGNQVLAPYGDSGPNGWKKTWLIGIAGGFGVGAVAAAFFYRLGRRRALKG